MSVRAVGLVLAVAAAVVHGALAVASPSAVALAMLPLAAGCLLCARHLERALSWAGCAVLDAAMLGLMLLDHVAAATGPVVGAGHHGGHAVSLLPGTTATVGRAHGLMAVAEALVVAQLALAVVVLLASLLRAGGVRRAGAAGLATSPR
ncbi:hypothetical protein FHN55_16855 [Streptomyces sp. NP160]|uniref:hypothetical protein n=1 Tax=Streptomyces sp. NP160 TaxID=2586637 RepID=UPI0011183706|nr:hypothetical protein [Streptomyces sp. NP160]TNM61503.1 hypothetical protein FHN55_16855 [Streptomyces sp. NP160]